MKIDLGKFGQIGLDLKRTVVNFAEWTGQSETQNYWKLYWQQRPQRTPWTRRSFSENERKFNSVCKKNCIEPGGTGTGQSCWLVWKLCPRIRWHWAEVRWGRHRHLLTWRTAEQWRLKGLSRDLTYSEAISVLARQEEAIIKRSQVVAMLPLTEYWRKGGEKVYLYRICVQPTCPDVRPRPQPDQSSLNLWRHKDMRGQNWHTNILPGLSPPHLLPRFPGNLETKCCQMSM